MLGDFSKIALCLSYFISIAFYIRILSAFFLKNFSTEDPLIANLLTTAILFFIGGIGYFRGFKGLEFFMECAVNINLSVIAMLIVGLFMHDWLVLDFQHMAERSPDFSWISLRKIFGVLLIVQGFEISRYIGNEYSAELRIKAMRLAQIIASAIYFIFFCLIIFIIGGKVKTSETEIIDLSRVVSFLLPMAVTVGAMFSQFSAAIADTVGCGGTIFEYFGKRIYYNTAYFIITIISIIIIWSHNIFEIISLSSQTFAAYYFIQCLQALYVNEKKKIKGILWKIFVLCVSIIMLLIMLFALPA